MNMLRHQRRRPGPRASKGKAGLGLRSSKSEEDRVLRSPKGEEDRVRRSSKSEGGFTLVELLTVIAVMGIMLGVAVVGFNHFGRGVRLRTAGRLVQQQLDLARQRALTSRKTHGVQFVSRAEPERDRLRIYYEESAGNKITVGRWTELPPGIEFGAAPPPVGADMPPQTDGIQFRPTGRADSSTYSFKIHDTETEKEREIEVVPVTGHTRISVP